MFGITHSCSVWSWHLAAQGAVLKIHGRWQAGRLPCRWNCWDSFQAMQRKSLALHQHHRVVVAVVVHRQGLWVEVVTVLAQAWCCNVPAHVESFAIPNKSLCLKHLAFGKSGGSRAQGPTWLLQTAFLGDKHQGAALIHMEAQEMPLMLSLEAAFLCLTVKMPCKCKNWRKSISFLTCLSVSPPRNPSVPWRAAVLSAALPCLPSLMSPGLCRGTEQHFHSSYLID